jgi:hypothetical protein
MSQIVKIQDRVFSSPSSIFTREDVLNLLKDLEFLQNAEAETAAKAAAEQAPPPVDTTGFYSPKQVRDLVLSISEAVEDRLINYDFSSDIDLELYGNEIQAEVSTTDLVKEVMERIVETANEELDLKMA